MGHDHALDLNGGHPLSAALDDVFAAVRNLEVPVAVYRGHIAGGEPLVLQRGVLVVLRILCQLSQLLRLRALPISCGGHYSGPWQLRCLNA